MLVASKRLVNEQDLTGGPSGAPHSIDKPSPSGPGRAAAISYTTSLDLADSGKLADKPDLCASGCRRHAPADRPYRRLSGAGTREAQWDQESCVVDM